LDNITHSMVGLLMAEAALRIRESRSGESASTDRLRTSAIFVSILANNAPDADPIYASLITDPLGSLLHHRGHTHTLTLVPFLAALCVGVTLGVARLRGIRFERRETTWLFVLGLLGVATHIALDASNSYGVHPFWPFYDGWLYGDSVFIVEPLIWVALITPLIFSVRSHWAKVVLASVVVFGVGLCWLRELVPRVMAVAVTLVAILSALASRRATAGMRVILSAASTTAVALTFVATGALARREVDRASASAFPRAITHDVVLTPMPADPLCWQIVLVQTEGERYFVRSGNVAIFSALMTSTECPFDIWSAPTAPSRPIPVAPTPSVRWIREFSAPLVELETLARENCVFAALLRFARAPYWSRDDALGRVAGDIRYDRSAGLDFSDTLLDGIACPKNLPPWIPPRQRMLEGAGAR
jgi:inner membrane protein